MDSSKSKNLPEELKIAFYELKSPNDIAALLDIRFNRLVYHLYLVSSDKRYKTFTIPKKSGGERQISTPITALKIIQQKLNQVLQAVYQVKPSVHGFVQSKNIVTNAKAHVKKRYVLNLDLQDFFPSINFGRVRGMFMATPYHLPPDVATVLAQICCQDNQLPQGAPTSPIITNMICSKMDSHLQRLAKDCKATYTRYADDITFSTAVKDFPTDLARIEHDGESDKLVLGDHLLRIIEENGFKVNEKKTRLQTKNQHQEVTGLTTGNFPNVDRRFVRQVRAMLHAWEKFDLESAQKDFEEKYNHKDRFPGKDKPRFRDVLRGRIEFIGMVKGKDDSIYQKYSHEFYLLSLAYMRKYKKLRQKLTSYDREMIQARIESDFLEYCRLAALKIELIVQHRLNKAENEKEIYIGNEGRDKYGTIKKIRTKNGNEKPVTSLAQKAKTCLNLWQSALIPRQRKIVVEDLEHVIELRNIVSHPSDGDRSYPDIPNIEERIRRRGEQKHWLNLVEFFNIRDYKKIDDSLNKFIMCVCTSRLQ